MTDVLLLLLLRWCSDERKYTYPFSMMHRRLTTADIEVAPQYHQLLVIIIVINAPSAHMPARPDSVQIRNILYFRGLRLP